MDADKVIEMQSVTNPTRSHSPRVLILGGTSEATELAVHLAARADMTVISSFAGRVRQPRLPAGIVRAYIIVKVSKRRSQPIPYKKGLGGLRIVPGNGLDAKNTALRILCFSGQYCPISRGRAEIKAHQRCFADKTYPTLAANDTVSDHKTS